MADIIKVGIVGVGGYGRLLLDQLLEEQEQGAVRIEMAVVSFPEKDAEHLAYLREQSPETQIFKTLNDGVVAGVALDLMVLPVGIGAHKEFALAALAAGWNVLVEKPLAGSVEDALQMVEAAEASDRFMAVGFQDMYSPHALMSKAALVSGAIGEVQSVRAFGMWGRSVDYYERNTWAGSIRSNGADIYDSPFNNGMAHYLNLALFLAGPNAETPAFPVQAEGMFWRAHNIESCDTAALRWKTENGVEVSILFSHTGSDMIGPELLVEGSRGSLYWKFNSHWELRPDDAEWIRQRVSSALEMRVSMIRQVLARVRSPEVSVFTPRQAMAQVQAVSLAHAGIHIQSLPKEIIHRSKDEKGAEWLEVDGLKQAGLKFFKSGKLGAFKGGCESSIMGVAQ